ncbi:MAG: hypothetical protein ACPGRH_02565 [Alphaproteobacteria bacterium]
MHKTLINFLKIITATALLSLTMTFRSTAQEFPDSFEAIHELQAALTTIGYDPGPVDGLFGSRTALAYTEFCEERDINPESDYWSVWPKLLREALDVEPYPLLSISPLEELNLQEPVPIDYTPSAEVIQYCTFPLTIHEDDYVAPRFILTETLRVRTDLERLLNEGDGHQDILDPHLGRFYRSIREYRYRCHMGDDFMCDVIFDLVSEFAATFEIQSSDFHPHYAFDIELRMLLPLIEAYDTAVLQLGVPSNHAEIGDWFFTAIYRVSYRQFANNKFQDFSRERFIDCYQAAGGFESANNHNIQSGYLWGLYGLLWKYSPGLDLALDVLTLASESVDDQGRLMCEIDRGALAIYYSGKSLHQQIMIVYLMDRAGVEIRPEVLYNLDRAALFLVNATFDNELLGDLPSPNRLNWCTDDWKIQCTENNFQSSFGWVPAYQTRFPEASGTVRINEIQAKMSSSNELTDKYKAAAQSFVLGILPNSKIRHNIIEERLSYPDDLNLEFWDLESDSGGGDASCISYYKSEVFGAR